MRIFVGIQPPATVTSHLTRAQATLHTETLRGALRLTPPSQWHVTLRFLGEVDDSRVPDLAAALLAALRTQPTFNLHLTDPGCFPGPERPQVIWFGLGGDLTLLMPMQSTVASACAAFATQGEDQPFHPHVTLARVREARPRTRVHLQEALQRMPRPSGVPWPVDAVCLVRSDLRPDGARYTTLTEIPLVRTR